MPQSPVQYIRIKTALISIIHHGTKVYPFKLCKVVFNAYNWFFLLTYIR